MVARLLLAVTRGRGCPCGRESLGAFQGSDHIFRSAVGSQFQEVWVRMTKKNGQNFAIVQEKVQQFLVTFFLFSDFQ
jgi:hypothetical protein